MSNITFEARCILNYLNEMGYRNITSEQLKEFMLDLKKLIKYEERLGVPQMKKQVIEIAERLYKTPTVCSRAKLTHEGKAPKVPNSRQHKLVKTEKILSIKPNKSNDLKSAKKVLEQKPASEKAEKMWIRPKLKASNVNKFCDPVQLYQYYQKEWARFKNCLPGENDHAELRWKIRHKILGQND